MTSGYLPVEGLDGVYVGQRGKLSSMALRLRDGSLCIYSPIAGLDKALVAQTDELGTISALLAPNHYHNKGLAAHVETFPDAALYCSQGAAPRLSKITGLAFDALDGLKEALSDRHTLHEPEGLKTGEVWVRVQSTDDCALIVTDAFSSELCSIGEFETDVTMLGTFPRYGVQDLSTYRSWCTRFLSQISPIVLLPCHGSPVKCLDLGDKLTARLGDLS